jgi:hypothetical protein
MAYSTITVTVTDDSPLTVMADGADTAVPATKASDVGALSIGDRVVVEVRTPQPPLVTSIETATA